MARSELATMVEREPRFLSGVMTEGSIWWADGGEREVSIHGGRRFEDGGAKGEDLAGGPRKLSSISTLAQGN